MKISGREKKLMWVAIIALSIFIGSKYIINIRYFEYFSINKKVRNLENKQNAILKKISNYKKVEIYKKIENKKYNELLSFFYTGNEKEVVVTFINDLNKIRNKNRITYTEQRIEQSNYDDEIIKMETTVTFNSDYNTFISFLKDVEKNRKFRVKKCTVTKNIDKNTTVIITITSFFKKYNWRIN